MRNPFIQSVPVLSKTQVEEVNKFLDNSHFQRYKSTIFGTDGLREDTSVRSSLGFTLAEGEFYTGLIGQAINEALLVYRDRLFSVHPAMSQSLVPGTAGTSSHREAIQILEYGPDQKYNFHYDMNWDRSAETYYRTVSVVLYLTSDFEGGGTEFVDKVYKAKPGHALIFPSHWSYPHSGQLVTSGMKRVAVTWYYVYPTPQ